jgi:Ca-activated chloride channel family protein
MKLLTLHILVTALLVPLLLNGHGIIIIDHPNFIPEPPHRHLPPRPMQKLLPLEVRSLNVQSSIEGQKATTEFKQIFFNPSHQQLEGTFLFPIPGDAAIDGFEMEVNGKLTSAELLDAGKARKIYEDIVRKARDPALFEYAGQRLFKVRIFPIEPRKEKEIRLKYTQLLPKDGNLVRYICPLDTRKFSTRPIGQFSLKIDLETAKGQRLGTLYSPTHEAEINRKGKNAAVIGLETKNLRAKGDFELLFSQKGKGGEPLDIQLLTHKGRDEDDGHFLLLLSPQAWGEDRKPLPKDVLFVLDTSGSMNGEKMDQAKKAMEFCIESLNPEDRFEIIRFSTEADPLFNNLEDASEKNVEKALLFVKKLRAAGGTAIDEALRSALETIDNKKNDKDRLTQVLFLTDGRPTIGETREETIVEKVRDQMKKSRIQPRIFNFGIGTDVNTHLLDKIAENAGTFSQYVFPGEDLEHKVSTFFTKISEPALANLKLKAGDGLRITKTYPRNLPDLFHGGQLTVVGRYETGNSKGTLQLEGKMGEDKINIPYEANFSEKDNDNAFIPRLWATRRVGYLLDEIRLHGDNRELRDEVVSLARAHGIVTPYTSYLIVEDEERRGIPVERRSFSSVSGNRELREQLADGFGSFSRSKSGLDALVGASSALSLKSADFAIAPEAVVPPPATPSPDANASPAPVFSASSPAGKPLSGKVMQKSRSANSIPVPQDAESKEESAGRADSAQPSARNISGKTFYLNDGIWIDSEAQQLKDIKPIKIKFGSEEYFDLLKAHDKAQQWLSVGTRCQIVIEGKLYEITE